MEPILLAEEDPVVDRRPTHAFLYSKFERTLVDERAGGGAAAAAQKS